MFAKLYLKNKRIVPLFLFALAIAVAFEGGWFLGITSKNGRDLSLRVNIKDGETILGSPAPITFVEYSDFQESFL
jgi:hypothetical protein